MTEYEAANLRAGDQIIFWDGTLGTVQSLRNDWVKVAWQDGTVAELPVDDFSEIEFVQFYQPAAKAVEARINQEEIEV